MEIFKGWYRKSFSRKDSVWHRCISASGIMNGPQTISTLCGREFQTTKCDFRQYPDHRCFRCENLEWRQNIKTDIKFASIGRVGIFTKADAIHQLKRLLKTRTYIIIIWDIYCVEIKASWESDVSIDIGITDIITREKTRKTFTLEQVQADLSSFKSEIDNLVESTTKLATEQKKKKGLKGRLTECEDTEYFEEILEKAKRR